MYNCIQIQEFWNLVYSGYRNNYIVVCLFQCAPCKSIGRVARGISGAVPGFEKEGPSLTNFHTY